MVAMLLAVTLREIKKEYAVLLSLLCAVALMLWAVGTMAPIIEQIETLVDSIELDPQYGEILLKSLGIAVCTQLACDACKDAGETAIGAKVEFCGRVCLVASACRSFQKFFRWRSASFRSRGTDGETIFSLDLCGAALCGAGNPLPGSSSF